MSGRPNIEEAIKKVSSRYELVLAAAKRTLQLMKESDDIFLKDKTSGALIKKTFQAIQDIANDKVYVVRKGENND